MLPGDRATHEPGLHRSADGDRGRRRERVSRAGTLAGCAPGRRGGRNPALAASSSRGCWHLRLWWRESLAEGAEVESAPLELLVPAGAADHLLFGVGAGRLPLACQGKSSWASPVTASG